MIFMQKGEIMSYKRQFLYAIAFLVIVFFAMVDVFKNKYL